MLKELLIAAIVQLKVEDELIKRDYSKVIDNLANNRLVDATLF
jgi:hypothetical protein